MTKNTILSKAPRRCRLMAGSGVLALLAACTQTPMRDTYNTISSEMKSAAQAAAGAAVPGPVSDALLPSAEQLAAQLPKARPVLEERFNVAFNDVPAQQFFHSLVAGTRYNMLVHPEVGGNITANLKDVTIPEALEAVREMYGYDYRVEGTRISIRPLTMQSRMFQVNYLTAARRGSSNLRVTSTSVQNVANNSGGNNNGADNNNNNNRQNRNNNSGDPNSPNANVLDEAANVTTRSESDFWAELKLSLEAIVGSGKDGRTVVVSPQSGLVVIRGMPEDLRNVDRYLKATQLAVARQVILEAKILEVELSEKAQSGINWAAFGSRISAGMVGPGTALAPRINGVTSLMGQPNGLLATPGSALAAATGAPGSLFGLAFQSSNFAALISFLESQGTVHVLSSPRIATLNNQKAVLKIGTDEFFVTGVSTTTNTNATGNGTVSPNVTLQPFFSGVVLDVTPQIDEKGNIILHVHPSVSQVSTVNKNINLGNAGSLNLPLAASATSEMDSMVRGENGSVVAIGGLMRQSTSADRSQIPVAGRIPVLGGLFRSTADTIQKRELVVLIKPTIVETASDWSQDLMESKRRIEDLDPSKTTGRR
ncbi:MSHA biogenesis protein MshL [Duganella sp. CF458]|uniref:pilus (MSHA type) biogenesis protein MshL n=1 Tax=Duganella sp. CF458 TaxID=1884368 RepID=UPI0008F30187|nr:pilus (MSHA type) biogenesis protein MshL [Duganella sp. CF458]SFG63422.1 MSHA biogenesis protein MshL [Duganella sp. CF458]